MTEITYRNIPFRIVSPALKTLPVIVTTVLSQVYTKDWEHKPLAAKIAALKDATDKLKNPPRMKALVHLTAWYGVALDLRAVIPDEKKGLVAILDNMLTEFGWLKTSWEFMQQEIDKRKAAQQ